MGKCNSWTRYKPRIRKWRVFKSWTKTRYQLSINRDDKKKLKSSGVNYIVNAEKSPGDIYKQISTLKAEKQITYLVVDDGKQLKTLKQIATGMLFSSMDKGRTLQEITLDGGKFIRHERNLVIGPVLTEAEYEDFAVPYGVAQIIFLDVTSTTKPTGLANMKVYAKRYETKLHVIPMVEGYEETLIPLLDNENGLNYIMTDKNLLQEVNDFIKKS